MLPLLQLLYRYILLGIATALSLVTHTETPSNPIADPSPVREYHSPVETLDFIFTPPIEQPILIAEEPVTPKVDTNIKPEIKTVVPTSKPKVTTIADNNTFDAVVNIICVETLGNLTRTTTGSGVLISSTGVILTNAHVAVDALKANSDCSIRTGGLASGAYNVSLLYIPDRWLEDNQDYINAGILKTSTGEHDFALLLAKQMSGLSHMNIDNAELSIGDDIQTVGYPAERVGLFNMFSRLYRVSDETEVKKIYSFGYTDSDVFSTGTVSNAEQGSSGGAIIKDGKLAGIIANVNSGTINALSLGYIEKYFKKDTGKSLDSILK